MIGCTVIYEEGIPNKGGNAQVFPIYEQAVSHIWLCTDPS